MKKVLAVVVAVVFVFGVSGMSYAMCGTCGTDKAEASEVGTKAVDAGNKICPVSGEKIDEKTKATYEYEGKNYNLCCPACEGAFKADPKKYVKKVNEELNKTKK